MCARAHGAGLLIACLLTACSAPPIRTGIERLPTSVMPPVTQPVPPAPARSGTGYTLKRGGGFYRDDGPGDNPPSDAFLEAIPDAVPHNEPLHRFANRPYSVLGREYRPLPTRSPYQARGIASWYGRKFHGQKTSSGERYDMYGMTAAHTTLPIPSYARVTNPSNGRSVVVRINDRGPFHADRLIDLSYAAAWKLDYVIHGSTTVEIESVQPDVLNGAPDGPNHASDPLASLLDRVEQAQSGMPAKTSLPELQDSQGIFLQLGAFSNPDHAENLKMKLGRELSDQADTASFSDKLTVVSRVGLYRVYLGPWPDHVAATQAAGRLHDLFGIKTMMAKP